VNFCQTVSQTPNLSSAWKPGLGALRARDRPHVKPQSPHQLSGSVDLDKALKKVQPHANSNRWDFGIGYRHTNRAKDFIYWVEIHTASQSEVDVILAKLRWLREWLQGDGRALNRFERDFIWISSGSTSFTLTSPQQKQFALLGLQHKGKVLRVLNVR